MNYAPELIGVGKYTTELATFLAGRGHDVEVVAALPHYPGWTVRAERPWRYETQNGGGVRVTRCPLVAHPGHKIWRLIAPLSFALLAAPVVLWRILVMRPATILCVEPTLMAAPAALLGGWLVGARTILHVQDLEFDAAVATGYVGRSRAVLLFRYLERALRRRFTAIVTIADGMAARLRAQVAPTPVHVLRNWVQTTGSAGPTKPPLPETGSADRRKLVLYAGALGAKQGVSVLIAAARHLRADPDIRILVVGEGAMAGAVRAAAAGLPNLEWRGLLPTEDLRAVMVAADCHVLPQEKAAGGFVFPSKLGPILALGKPLAITAEAQSELAVWLGGAAVRAPPGDGAALAAAIRRALVTGVPDPPRAQRLASSLAALTILPAFEALLWPDGEPARANSRATAGEEPGNYDPTQGLARPGHA